MTDHIEDGGPAFPTEGQNYEKKYSGAGMTLRDYFAAKAMQAFIANGVRLERDTEQGVLIVPGRTGIPPLAYEYADEMLKARKS